MSEFDVLIQEYQLDPSHAADLGDDCITINANLGEDAKFVSSGAYVINQVNEHLGLFEDLNGAPQHRNVESASKLYVVGDWTCNPSCSEEVEKSAAAVCDLIKAMRNLKDVTWMSGLPFVSKVFDALPHSLEKLIVDISQPVEVSLDAWPIYLSPEDMKSLFKFTNLRELRIFGMRDSLQSIAWETVFRNKTEYGMHVLDLRMSGAPLVRQNHWIKAKEVVGLKVTNKDPIVYKGIDGKGVLHYGHGTGEYLDDYCIRKARIAAGLDEGKPLPLWCLKLDGFVIDQLPLEHELKNVVLLTLGSNCIDAGLRAPKTHRASTKWGPSVNNEATHCLISWPNWAAIFDNEGQLLDKHGKVVLDSLDEAKNAPESLPLTEESLMLNEIKDALDAVTMPEFTTEHRNIRTSSIGSAGTDFSAGKSDIIIVVNNVDSDSELASDISVRGSAVPSPGYIEKDFDI